MMFERECLCDLCTCSCAELSSTSDVLKRTQLDARNGEIGARQGRSQRGAKGARPRPPDKVLAPLVGPGVI